MVSSLIQELLKRLPHRPGVYLMRDAGRDILYVGKASNLHHRVRSYFQATHKLTPKIQRMVAQIADIDFYIAGSEQEALIMELNFIKQYHPRYNVHLKDDKTFPYLKIDTRENFPRVYVTRRFEPDGGRYFGPFSNAGSVKQTLYTSNWVATRLTRLTRLWFVVQALPHQPRVNTDNDQPCQPPSYQNPYSFEEGKLKVEATVGDNLPVRNRMQNPIIR